jgi:pimeloyl-ACP methyl ester carboxylesterase
MTTRPHPDSSMVRADHPAEVRQAYERVVAGTSVRGRVVEVAGNRVHLLEIGTGPPLVLLHGGGGSGGFFLPLLSELRGVRALAPDRPGQGLSDPIDLPRDRYRRLAVAWVDGLLDTLEVDAAALLGHSGGAMWALWYALARPDRVNRLVLIGPPAVPKTRCPLPIRLAATPGLGELLSRLVPPSPKSVLQFAHHAAREKESLARYPELVDLFVATFGDPTADRVARAEERVFVSPLALVTASGFRRSARIRPDELRRVAMPTLVMWGQREPLGDVSVARAVAELIPRARLEVLAGGHGPWLGQPAQTAAAIADFVR